jgi:hypothetical protein
MIIKNIKDQVHVDDTDRDLPKVILIIPEQAFAHSHVNPEITFRNLLPFGIYAYAFFFKDETMPGTAPARF